MFSVKLRSVFCTVVLSACFRVRATVGKQQNVHMQSSQTVPELDEHDETWGADDVDDNDTMLAVDIATQAFLDFLLNLADESKISAKDVCVLCWYASKAGKSDDVRRIGFRLTHHRDTTSGT